jgi:hypothetical protein
VLARVAVAAVWQTSEPRVFNSPRKDTTVCHEAAATAVRTMSLAGSGPNEAAWLKQMLQGHLNYLAVSGNDPSLWWFFNEVRWIWTCAGAAAILVPAATLDFVRMLRRNPRTRVNPCGPCINSARADQGSVQRSGPQGRARPQTCHSAAALASSPSIAQMSVHAPPAA